MNEFQNVLIRLNEIVKMENEKPLDQLGSYIVGTLIVDEVGYEIYQVNDTVARIAELGSNLETSNGGEEWMQKDWTEVKMLLDKLNRNIGHTQYK